MTDIVERLRSSNGRMGVRDPNDYGMAITVAEANEAADEIERLRATVDVAEDEILRLRGALRRIAMPGVRMAYCRDGHEIAVLLARDALTTTTTTQHIWKCPINLPGCTANCCSYGCGN
ncbi:hypothetical protein UFOVP732_19 [uncultured Caudovirales phage]|uniref:Uncharacterized protein n=1 Tax=uncultured Caudovirales phage TaxID=2100421 RepID=A0A6J5NUZ4_9CAUD|nr:hypothetical protein UFOVP732_19 [uncultured Caudovirales phage]